VFTAASVRFVVQEGEAWRLPSCATESTYASMSDPAGAISGPIPAIVIVSSQPKVAVTVRSFSIVTEHDESVPLQSPPSQEA
jgi:hypothetical protein